MDSPGRITLRTPKSGSLVEGVILHVMTDQTRIDNLIVETMLSELPDVQSVYRYGSAGSQYERQDSDIDIAFLATRRVPFMDILNLSARLADLIGRDIDLNELKILPVTLRVQIVTQGTRIYCADRVAAETYETHTLSDYVRLNEERQFILKDIRQRAQIYG